MSSLPCLVCGRLLQFTVSGGSSDDDDASIISKQLHVIFILKHLLHVPRNKLENFVKTCGNPDGWIRLCEKCTQITGEARSLHSQILKLSSKLRELQKEIVEITRTECPGNSLSPKFAKTNPQMIIWKETRAFVNKHNYEDQCGTGGTNCAKDYKDTLRSGSETKEMTIIIKHETLEDFEEEDEEDSEFFGDPLADSDNLQDNLDTDNDCLLPTEEENEQAEDNTDIDVKLEFPGDLLKVTEDPLNLNVHLDSRHPSSSKRKSEGPKVCTLCGTSFVRKETLKWHIQSVHLKTSEDKKVKCHHCGLPFKKDYLKKHVLFMHKGEKGVGTHFQCGVVGCKLFFVRKEGLDKHMIRKHGGSGGSGGGAEGKKQFSCSYCGKGFYFRNKLEMHELSHRNEELGIRPFVCDICGMGFGTPHNLTCHVGKKHKN